MLNRLLALVGLICLLWTGGALVDASAPARKAVDDLQVLAEAGAEAKRQLAAHDPDALGRFKAKRQLQRELRKRWNGEVEYALDTAELDALSVKFPRVLGMLDGYLLVRAPEAPVSESEHRMVRMLELGLRPPFLLFGVLALTLAVLLPHGPREKRAAPVAAAEQLRPHPELEAHLARLNALAAARDASEELADRVREKTEELRELLQSVPEQNGPAVASQSVLHTLAVKPS